LTFATRSIVWLSLLALAGCFEEPPYDVMTGEELGDAETEAGSGDPVPTPAIPHEPEPEPEPEPDPEPDPEPLCGDGTPDPSEECDDGNALSGDGCSETCRLETTGCAPGTVAIADDVARGIAICEDPDHATCEESFASLCAPGWHLCSAREHMARNDDWIVTLTEQRALGVVRCRNAGGAGHYTVHNPGADGTDNCQVGSSRAECPSALGCDEAHELALCCARVPTCGNGIVDDPYEECDDGNDSDADSCSRHCASTFATGPSC